MTKYLAALFLLITGSPSWAQKPNPVYGQPIIVLIETDPWLMVIGSDTPSFALYENGQIIYQWRWGQRVKYVQVQHDRAQTQAFIKTLGITDILMLGRDAFVASNATRTPTQTMILLRKKNPTSSARRLYARAASSAVA